MTDATTHHNPGCGTSRDTLALLREAASRRRSSST
jgi:hypothetical protein